MSDGVQERSIAHRLIRTALVALGLLSVVGLVIGVLGWVWLDKVVLADLPEDLSSYREWRPITAVQVYDVQGTRVDQFYVERRYWVDLDELPIFVGQAFISAEDRRFYEHDGVDPLGILRAVVVNYQSGQNSQGASTLTQQLVKNLIVGSEQSYERKLKEAVLARRLEKELGKEGILELYLNYVALGNGNYGVEAAARDYFGISAVDLNPGQAAMLAGLVPAPSRYSPRRNPVTAHERRRLILRAMREEGYIKPDVEAYYLDSPVVAPSAPEPSNDAAAAYITVARREVRRLFGETAPFELGLQVHTPMDPGLQQVAFDAVNGAVQAHFERQGRIGPQLRVQDIGSFVAKQEPVVDPQVGDCFVAVVPSGERLGQLESPAGRVSLRWQDRAALVRSLDSEEPSRPLSAVVRAGDVLNVCWEGDGQVRAPAEPWAEGAAVVIENRTGQVVALVGGTDVGLEGYIRATQAERQPGSSFKPYVYAAALARGATQVDEVVDGPLSLGGGRGGAWSPKNYGGGYAGRLPMRSALARSLNTVSVRLILDSGSEAVVDTARGLGVRTPLRRDLTIALGSSEVTPLDQAVGYSAIARGGVPIEPVFIGFLDNAENEPLGVAGDRIAFGNTSVELPGRPGPRALDEAVAFEMVDMLRAVVSSGTGRRAAVPGEDRAGKTGTTNDAVDTWFVGTTATHTIAVWIGTDGTVTLGRGETGGRTALPAWKTIADALPPTPGVRIEPPPSSAWWWWGGEWVAIPRGAAPDRLVGRRPTQDAALPPFGE